MQLSNPLSSDTNIASNYSRSFLIVSGNLVGLDEQASLRLR